MLIFGRDERSMFNNDVLNVKQILTDWLLQQPHVQSAHFSPQLLQYLGCVTLNGL
jgi:hypothetical protein